MLSIYAGNNALEKLSDEGFHPGLFHTVLGASGGPKWFVLAGIDRVMVTEFLDKSAQKIDFIGSSAGAFRFGCLTQKDPVNAINLLAKHYSETVYSDKPTVKEISDKAELLINTILPQDKVQEVLDNPRYKANFIVARCRGLTVHENKLLQNTGLLMSAVANACSRKLLGAFFERVIFSVDERHLPLDDPYNLPTAKIKLSANNMIDALLASGAIPGVLRGINEITGAPKGMYRDGGVTDYHFDLGLPNKDGLVLYPHFFSRPAPGWFDKMISWRRPHKSSYDDVVMVVPSDDFIQGLPYCKIPDRHDFVNMSPEQRLPYWRTVLSESDRLGEAFLALQSKETLLKSLKPLPFALAN
ncbi:MAG: patatin-like phospholipase family protein [Aestuariibacter sp.]